MSRLLSHGVLILTLLCMTIKGYCWNTLGHRLVAQIAYHHMTKDAKRFSNYYNRVLNGVYRPQNLINAAAWLDSYRRQNEPWLSQMHYIDIPFSLDETQLIPAHKMNAVSAIEEAKAVLQNNEESDFNKGLSLRILLHVVGDIHQPLHAASQFSANFPEGDKGGNLLYLGKNPIATNLHSYWDKGGGLLISSRYDAKSQLNKRAYIIEGHWPCHLQKMNLDSNTWANESHQIAISDAYQIKAGQKPSKQYQHKVNQVTEEQLALAGCRLAALLNTIVRN